MPVDYKVGGPDFSQLPDMDPQPPFRGGVRLCVVFMAATLVGVLYARTLPYHEPVKPKQASMQVR